MKLRYKILNGVGILLVLGIAGLMVTVSYTKDCPDVVAYSGNQPSMRAMTQRCYGGPRVLRLETVEKPVPGDGQILIKVHASSVNPADWHSVTGQPRFLRLMKGLGAPADHRAGTDVAGVVEAIGPNVVRFKVGDAVFGGVGAAYAEYAIGRDQRGLAKKPENLTFEEAAGLPIAGITALQGLRDQGGVKPGMKVLINGASGGVGTYAVQIAKALGAEVTGVCSTRNVEMVRSLGADHVIDYKKENFTEGTARYDVILDNVSSQGFGDMTDVMNPKGVIVIVGGSKKGPFLGPIKRVAWSKVAGLFIEPEIKFFVAQFNKEDMEFLAELAAAGKLKTVIDRRYPLEQTAAALDYLGEGHARGKVIVTVE